MIRADDLSLQLGKTKVVANATASFASGRVTAILGPNGAGKSSLIRALAGLIAPCSGFVTLDAAPISEIPQSERARRIGYLPQEGAPAWNITVEELVGLGRLPHRSHFAAPVDRDQAAIANALVATDTAHLAGRTMEQLSGGERARAKIARVLAGDPDWIIADEPLANLDPPHQRDVLRLFQEAARAGKGVIIVLHQLNAAARVADDIVLMANGEIVAQGSKRDVLTSALLEATFGMAFDLITQAGQPTVIAPKAYAPPTPHDQ